ncbi:hypothetical protein I9S53_14310 [Hyphomicrobium sulfonivorans]|nr:hypothetical protein [Hyphomicrobium sulfonivorans]
MPMTDLLETSDSRKAGPSASDKLARIGKSVPPSTAVTVGTIVIFAIAVAIISAFGVKRSDPRAPASHPSQVINPANNNAG